MKEKGVIRGVVDWTNARRYFAERLRRRQGEEQVVRAVAARAPSVARATVFGHLQEWFRNDVPGGDWQNDTAVATWLERHDADIQARLHALEREHITAAILREAEKDKQAAVAALLTLMRSLDPQERADLANKLRAL